MKEIEAVSIEKINEIIEKREPRGLFLAREPKGARKRLFIAVDNSDGKAWTEEFEKFSEARKWLKGEVNGVRF